MSKKVLQFASKQLAKSWVNFQITPPRPSVDPNLPPMYILEVRGQRGDGVTFTIPVQILKEKYDLLIAGKALEVSQTIIQGAVKRLMTFTGCPCTSDSECDDHKQVQAD